MRKGWVTWNHPHRLMEIGAGKAAASVTWNPAWRITLVSRAGAGVNAGCSGEETTGDDDLQRLPSPSSVCAALPSFAFGRFHGASAE